MPGGGGLPDAGVFQVPPAGVHPRIYLNNTANIDRLKALLAANDPAAVRLRDAVNRRLAGSAVNFELHTIALMFHMTGDARYAELAVRLVDEWVSSEETRIAGGMNAAVAGDSYLEVGRIIGDVMLVYDWCFSRLTDAQRKRWLDYANQAVWNVWNFQKATWGGRPYPWSGWSVPNPNNNYHYSFLRATMLFGLATRGEHPNADEWLTMFRDTKVKGALVPAFMRDLEGGGSREGNGYGTSHSRLFTLYDMWWASTGERLDLLTPHARDSLFYKLHTVVPTLDKMVTIGDFARESTGALYDYDRHLLLAAMWLYPGERATGVAQSLLKQSSIPQMSQPYSYVHDLMYRQPALIDRPPTDLSTVYFAKGVGHGFMRSAWSKDATFASFIAGPYTESHAHRDQGSFTIYKKGWLAYEVNYDSRSGIRQEEEAHNLVRISSDTATFKMKYDASSQLLGLADNARLTYMAANITPMYAGIANGPSRVEREFVYIKPDTFVIFDRVTATGTKTWQMSVPTAPAITGNVATVTGPMSKLTTRVLLPAGATPTSFNWSTTPGGDFRGGHRIDVVDRTPGASFFLTVLGVDDAVSSAEATAGTGTRGCRLVLADGRQVTVEFNEATTGGAVSIGTERTALTASVATLPRYTN